MKRLLVLLLFTMGEVNLALIYEYDGRAYYVSYPEKADWYSAVRFCIQHDMYLIEVYNEVEDTIILSVIKSVNSDNNSIRGDYWTGGTNFPSGEHYYWASTGHPFVYTNWVGTRNESDTSNCVYYDSNNRHRWNSIECSHKLFFICRDSFDLPVYQERECSVV